MTSFRDQYRRLRVNYPDAPAQFELVVRHIYSAILKPGDVAVDCGAHTGKHTLPMASCVAHTGKVYAFEPIYEKLGILEKNSLAAGFSETIVCKNAALGERPHTAEFSYLENEPGKSALHLRSFANTPKIIKRIIDVITIDEELKSVKACAFMKTDVEGAELNVFLGADDFIRRTQPVIHFEMGEPSLKAFGVEPIDIFRFLDSRGYRIYDIIGNRLESQATFLESAGAGNLYDYIAFPELANSPQSTINGQLVAKCARQEFLDLD